MRSLILTSLTLSGVLAVTTNVDAGWRRRWCGCTPAPSCCAPAPTCAAAVTPVPQASPAPAQAQAPGYQSFSYEPDPTAAPINTARSATGAAPPARTYAPAGVYQRRSQSLYNQVRGDRKVRGY
jgi:hypothetical protein